MIHFNSQNNSVSSFKEYFKYEFIWGHGKLLLPECGPVRDQVVFHLFVRRLWPITFFLNHWSKTNDRIAYNNLSVKVSPLASRSCRSATVICGSPSCWSTKNLLCSSARFLKILLWTTNFHTLCLANYPSWYHGKYSAQSWSEGHVTGRFMWKSPFPYGNKQGNAMVQKWGVVNSDAGLVSVVGHGITGRCTSRIASSASPSLGSETTSFMAASTCACTFTPCSGRIIPVTFPRHPVAVEQGLGHPRVLFQKIPQFSNWATHHHEKTHRACTVSIAESSIQFLIILL